MKINNLRHQLFIKEMIAHGNRQQAYLAAYPGSSPRSAYANACRLLSNPLIRGQVLEARSAIHSEMLEGMKDEIKDKFVSMAEKRVWLARIMTGEKIFPHVVTRKRRPVVEYRVATPAQLLTAIELDAKLEAAMQVNDYHFLTTI